MLVEKTSVYVGTGFPLPNNMHILQTKIETYVYYIFVMAEFECCCNYFLLSLSPCCVYADDVCISVEMYKCEHMVDTCVECLSPADVMDTKYNCGWCQHLSSSCQVAQLCPTNANFLEANKSNCPFLEISQVSR